MWKSFVNQDLKREWEARIKGNFALCIEAFDYYQTEIEKTPVNENAIKSDVFKHAVIFAIEVDQDTFNTLPQSAQTSVEAMQDLIDIVADEYAYERSRREENGRMEAAASNHC